MECMYVSVSYNYHTTLIIIISISVIHTLLLFTIKMKL